jgi:acyl-CoA synthetase (AMP-forming)/AMP-acid ligase II
VLLAHGDIGECAVVGVEDPEWGQKIGLIFTPSAATAGTQVDYM